jgi:hypothetical protein
MAAPKRIKIILASLTAQGARVKETTKGWIVFFPDEAKTSMTMHKSESDHRAEANNRARVLRAGLTWPFDGENRGR